MFSSTVAPLPEWLLLALAVWFFVGAGFYLYRLLFPKEVHSVYGYWDVENEVGHAVCMLAMVTMLSPMLLPIPFLVWTGILCLASLWFIARALTWGRRLSYNVWWWDWAHVGMLGGMALMFANVTFPVVLVITGVFWTWFSLHYAKELWDDAKTGKVLYIGSDVAHLTMGVMMLIMTLLPGLFMSHMGM